MVSAVLEKVNEMKRALLTERKTNAFFKSSGKLFLKKLMKLDKELEDALIRLEGIPNNPSETPPISVSKNINAPLKFSSEAKRPEQYKAKIKILKKRSLLYTATTYFSS